MAGARKAVLRLIESACKNGADLIKIQTYATGGVMSTAKHGQNPTKFTIEEGMMAIVNTAICLWNACCTKRLMLTEFMARIEAVCYSKEV